jgi:hypothetical protein
VKATGRTSVVELSLLNACSPIHWQLEAWLLLFLEPQAAAKLAGTVLGPLAPGMPLLSAANMLCGGINPIPLRLDLG